MIETKINVYLDNELTDTFEFLEEDHVGFLICIDKIDGNKLSWQINEPFGNKFHNSQSNQKASYAAIVVWYSGYNLGDVPPDWDLWINSKKCETGLYRNLGIKWPKVELVYKTYKFEFWFPAFEDMIEQELPSPIRKMSANEWHELISRK